jgi:hypothetical protein
VDAPVVKKTVLEEAQALVLGNRQAAYGAPLDNWTQTADMWSTLFGHKITAEQAVLAMMAVKMSREAFVPKTDNRVDIAGYALVLDMIIEERERRKGV